MNKDPGVIKAKSLFQKLWEAHLVRPETKETPAILYIDLHLVHEVTSPQGFDLLRARHLPLRRADRTLATLDHSTPTAPANEHGERPYATAAARNQVETLQQNCADFGIELHGYESAHRGVVHVMGPELGATQPGMTVVCGDSHTSTHGAFGALAFGIGTTEVGHVLATQCLFQRQPRSMRITVDGDLAPGVSAKDLALHIIRNIGVNGGTGFVIEYAGETIRALEMEGRMTLCNMTIEAGARAGMVGPDQKTVEYLRGRQKAPAADQFDARAGEWLSLATDPGSTFDKEIQIDAAKIRPTITFGTDPAMSVAIREIVPAATNSSAQRAMSYMQVSAGKSLVGMPIDVVFIGSCTNGRLSDLRVAADYLRGKKVADNVRMLVVPGSEAVKRAAEAEGLQQVFAAAGAEWREPGCSMCLAMNGDVVGAGKLAVSTSNRNFEGRQGAGARTMLASPLTAAACAVAGCVTDPTDTIATSEVA